MGGGGEREMGKKKKNNKSHKTCCNDISFLCYLFASFCICRYLRLHFPSLKVLLVLRFGARTDRERRKAEKRKLLPVLCSMEETALLGWPLLLLLLLLLPLPCRAGGSSAAVY